MSDDDAKKFDEQLGPFAAKPLPGTPKLTADDVREILRLRTGCNHVRKPAGDPANLQTMADRFGVTKACISRICHGHGWRELRKAETAEEAAGLPDPRPSQESTPWMDTTYAGGDQVEEDDAC